MSAKDAEVRKEIIIDAEGAILGRLASKVAQFLKEGYEVYVVNAEKAVVSGEKQRVIEGYKIWLSLRTLRNPEKSSPKRPRNPVSIVKYTVRGMLPKSFNKGRARLSKLKVFVGIPKELEGKEMVKLITRKSRKVVTVAEIAAALGWRGEEMSEAGLQELKIVIAVGKRKTAIAKAVIESGKGRVWVNGVPIEIWPVEVARMKMMEPLLLAGREVWDKVDIRVYVRGGGVMAQADAVRTAIARALLSYTGSEELKRIFNEYSRSMIAGDPRRTEPEKWMRYSARRFRQKSYR